MTRRYLLWLLAVLPVAAQEVPGRFVVELNDVPAPAKTAERRSAVSAQQSRVRAVLQQRSIDVVGAVQTVGNALIVETSRTRAELEALPDVRRVYPVRLYWPTLDRAVSLQKAVDAWSQAGGEARAGAGVKIGIIDTGIDASHAAFQDPEVPELDGYPRLSSDANRAYTNNKVIVARSYDRMALANAADRKGHGTAVAMVAAGVRNNGPLGAITGVAPKAYLGNYKVFPDNMEGAPNDGIYRAIDDAVSDGMDVINLSLGSFPAGRLADDFLVQAIERATAAGVVVVVSAGNSGPGVATLESPGTAPAAVTAGNSLNDRFFAGSATVEGRPAYVAIPGSGRNASRPLAAALVDISRVDATGLACTSFETGSLQGRVALVMRGECFFEDKLKAVAAAGAVAALIYTDEARPEPIEMAVGSASLPAAMISYSDGVDLKARLAANPDLPVTLDFHPRAFAINPWRIADSSSRGPSVSEAIKPDVLAVGTSVYTAAPSSQGQSQYTIMTGTSFSAPMIAGAAAVLKAARPGLTVQQYRSLLVNSANGFALEGGLMANVRGSGAGLLNVAASLSSTLAADPVSLGYGTFDGQRTLTLTNLSRAMETFSIAVVPTGSSTPVLVDTPVLTLGPGESRGVSVRLSGTNGEHHGFLLIQGTQSAVESRVAYWYAMPSNVASSIYISDADDGKSSSVENLLIRVSDAAGLPVDGTPQVTVVAGGGSVLGLESVDSEYPGFYQLRVRLGAEPGDNTFRVESGAVSRTVTIRGE